MQDVYIADCILYTRIMGTVPVQTFPTRELVAIVTIIIGPGIGY